MPQTFFNQMLFAESCCTTRLFVISSMKKRQAIILAVIVGFLVLVFRAERIIENLVYDNDTTNAVPCEQMPLTEEVEVFLRQNATVFDRIRDVNPRVVMVSTNYYPNCPTRSDVLIVYGSHNERRQIEKIINETEVLGQMPYVLLNK